MDVFTEMRSLLLLFFCCAVQCLEEISIHVINTPFETEMTLLPLAGSYDHEVSRKERQDEDNRYVEVTGVSDEGMSRFVFPCSCFGDIAPFFIQEDLPMTLLCVLLNRRTLMRKQSTRRYSSRI